MATRQALEAFDHAIALEASRLAQLPALTWQQLYNRLQWEGEEVLARLAPDLAHRSMPGSTPWLRTRAQRRESAGLVQVLSAEGGPPTGCAVAPDGSFIASTHLDISFTRTDHAPTPADYTLWIWDTETGRVRTRIRGISAPFSLSPDGTRVFAFSNVWNLSTGEVELELRGRLWQKTAFAWVPGRPILISAGHKSATGVAFWDAHTGKVLRTLPGHSGNVLRCAVSPDGSFLVAGGGRTVKVWDIDSGGLRETLTGPKNSTFNDYVISPDGSRVAASGEGPLRIFDIESGSQVATLGEVKAKGGFHACAFSPDGRFIAAVGAHNVIHVWDFVTAEEVAILEGHSSYAVGCHFGPDGAFLVSASEDGTIRVWDPGLSHVEEPLRESARHSGTPEQTFVAPKWARGRQVLTFRDVETGANVAAGDHYLGGILWPEASADRSIILTPAGKWDDDLQTVEVWDVASGRLRCTIRIPNVQRSISRMGMLGRVTSPEGSFVVTFGGSSGGTVVVWDAATGRPARTLFTRAGSVTACAITPDESTIVLGTGDGTVMTWDAEAASVGRAFKTHPHAVESIALSPDGSYGVSVGRHDREMRLWGVASQRSLALTGHTGVVVACAIGPDGAHVFSVSEDRTLRVWDARTGTPAAMLPVEDKRLWIAAHPWASLLAFTPAFLPPSVPGDARLADLFGVRLGALAVPVIDRGQPRVRCPACDARFPAARDVIGKAIPCPECRKELRLAGRIARSWIADAVGQYAVRLKGQCEPVKALIRDAATAASAYSKRTQPNLNSSLTSFDEAISHIDFALAKVGGTDEFRLTSALFDEAFAHVITCDDCKDGISTWFGSKHAPRPKRSADREQRHPSPPTPAGSRLRKLFRRSPNTQ